MKTTYCYAEIGTVCLAYCYVAKSDKTVFRFGRYVFGLTHIPRLEDWPVMPVERIGFMLVVSAFELFSVSVIGSEPKDPFVAFT